MVRFIQGLRNVRRVPVSRAPLGRFLAAASRLGTVLAVVLGSACGDATSPRVATQLGLVTAPPSTAENGVAFTRQPVVQLHDASGADVAVSGVAVSVAITSGRGVLSGAATVPTNDAGQATFDLAIVGATGPYTLQFSTMTPLATVVSNVIDLTAGPPSRLVLITSASAVALSGVPLPQQPVLQLRDAGGVDVPQRGVVVLASVASGYGVLGGTTTALTDDNGTVTYTDLNLTGAGEYTLQFAAVGVLTGTSATITLPSLLQGNAPTAPLDGAAGSSRWYLVSVPAGTSMLTVISSGGTGDANLYLRQGALPSATAFDCASTGVTTAERCDIPQPAAGAWYVLLAGASAYAGVSLTVPTSAPCTLATVGDSDGDRLPDCVETGTGVYVDRLNTGTDPHNPDTDADGISDGDEVLGTALGLDLPAMGVSPVRRDILIEYDWFDDALDCGAHSHRPTAAAMARLTLAFASAPIRNPDGSTGITIINDYGQGGVFTGGNLIADADGVLDGGIGGPEFSAYRQANFATNRVGYFHYVLLPHRYDTNSSSSGQAEQPGHNFIVSLYCANSDVNVANTVMHELGHNLGLRHGGSDDVNFKPNYNSVMNYLYTFQGISSDCTPTGSGILNYSVGTRPPLDEHDLDERQGVCGTPPGPGYDWNHDGDADDTGLALDLTGDGLLMPLLDFDDWANLALGALPAPAAGDRLIAATRVISCVHAELPWTRR